MNCPKNFGFTLVEFMAASLILLPLLTLLVQLFPNLLISARQSEEITKSMFLAEQKAEEIRQQALSQNPIYGFSHNYSQSATAFPSPNTGYAYIVLDDNQSALRHLMVTTWADSDANLSIGPKENRVIRNRLISREQ